MIILLIIISIIGFVISCVIGEDDIYSFEFMEDCYNKGKDDTRLHSHFGNDDHHIYDQIQKVLVKVITIVMNYED